MLGLLKGDESILDLGCGNGSWCANHEAVCGSYLGVDFSLPLLRDADPQPEEFSATFMTMDLTVVRP